MLIKSNRFSFPSGGVGLSFFPFIYFFINATPSVFDFFFFLQHKTAKAVFSWFRFITFSSWFHHPLCGPGRCSGCCSLEEWMISVYMCFPLSAEGLLLMLYQWDGISDTVKYCCRQFYTHNPPSKMYVLWDGECVFRKHKGHILTGMHMFCSALCVCVCERSVYNNVTSAISFESTKCG